MEKNNLVETENFKIETELKENEEKKEKNEFWDSEDENYIKRSGLSTTPELISLNKNQKKNYKKGIDKTFWVPDSEVKQCYNCGIDFSFIERKHHCRVCGNIFCKKCTFSFYERTYFDVEGELKCCAYCQDMCKKLNSIFKENLIEYKDEKGNKSFETKLYDYINRKNDDKIFKKILNEKDIQLNKSYHKIVNETIEKVLKTSEKYPNLSQNWTEILTKLLIQIFNNICPSHQDLNDSIDITKYIKIKTIEYQDQSLCEAIDGFAMRKNVCSKKMKTEIDNPTILLLDGYIGKRINDKNDNKDDFYINKKSILGDELANLSSSSEKAYLNIIKKKIEKLDPQIILLKESIIPEFQNLTFKDNSIISIVVGCKIKSLEEIARCTTSFVVPSIDLINKGIILGKCEKFVVKKIKKNTNNNLLLSSGDYNLMQFKGCGKKLFYTLILSGNNKDELKEVKQLLKNTLLKTIRDFYLQKKMFNNFNFYYPFKKENNNNCNNNIDFKDNNKNGNDEDDINNNKNEISDIKSKLNDNIDFNNNINNKNNNDCKTEENLNFKEGFNNQLINNENNTFGLVQITMNKGKNLNVDLSTSFKKSFRTSYYEDSRNESSLSIQESQILDSVYHICESFFVSMNFYSKNIEEEKTLGQLIIDLCNQKNTTKCKKCSRSFETHIFSLYKGSQRLNISLMDNSDKLLQKIIEEMKIKENNVSKNEYVNIYTFGYCEKCFNIVTPVKKLSVDVFNFSASKFYYHFFYNNNVVNIPISEYSNYKKWEKLEIVDCNHLAFKDISRIFLTESGTVKFSLEKVIKYIPIENQLNKNLEFKKKKNINELKILMKETKENSNFFIEEIEKNFGYILDYINAFTFEKLEKEMILLKNIGGTFLSFFIEIKEVNELFFKETFNDILEANVYIKLFYCRIFQLIYLLHCILKVLKNLTFIEFFEKEEKKFELIEKERSEKERIEKENKEEKEEEFKEKDKEEIKEEEKVEKKEEKNENDQEEKNKVEDKKIEKKEEVERKDIKEEEYIFKENKNEEKILENKEKYKEEEIKKEYKYEDNKTDKEEEDKKEVQREQKKENEFKEENKVKIEEKKELNEKKEENKEDKKNEIKEEKKEETKEENSKSKNPKNDYKKIFLLDFEKEKERFTSFRENLLIINKSERYKQLISKIKFFDSKHKQYAVNVIENDICSLISSALTSDEYLKFVNSFNKFNIAQLERIEIPINEIKDYKNEKIEINVNEEKDENKKEENDDNGNKKDKNNNKDNKPKNKKKKDASLFKSSLLFNLNQIEFKLNNLDREKILIQMKNNLMNEGKNTFIYSMKNDIKQLIFDSLEQSNKLDNISHPELFDKLHNNDLLNKYKQKFADLKSISKSILPIKKKYEAKEKLKFEKLKFEESSISEEECTIKIFFTIQFQAFRELYCSNFKDFILSMRKINLWKNVSGGKSKSDFFKTFDERFVIKCISKFEFKMFTEMCVQYFLHNYKYLFHKMPSAMAKIVGAFKIIKKSSNKNIEKIYCVVMENLSYNLLKPNINLKIYDLKGSRLNRYMKNKDQVLLDTNFREDFNGEPLVLDSDIYSLLRSAIINDSLLLSKMNVVDYSLLVIILNEDGKEDTDVKKIKFGILDYFRKYTWDKQLETRFKKLINNFKDPTIISPENYKKRFDEKISRYFIGT